MTKTPTSTQRGKRRCLIALKTTTALASILLLAACGGGDSSDPVPQDGAMVRLTSAGKIEGVDDSARSGTYFWKGIPFAQPPVGALRWAPPADPKAWGGVLSTQQFGHSCAQGGRYFSPAPNDAPYGLSVRDGFGKPLGDEDCLTLNVWRPAGTHANLPVIVFIYGGSNISGYSADPIYDGQALAKRANAVVVTLNYRVGMLGWLDLPQLKNGHAEADSGNFALLDQLQALKFVKNNIAAFGGDAGNVTVMGQSAGAVNVWALLTSPLSAGLMHKAVPLSGGVSNSTRAVAQTYSKALLNAIVVADGKATDAAAAEAWVATQSDAQIASYLRAMSADRLLSVMLANPQLGNSPAPIEDGAVVPLNAVAALAAGQHSQIPLLVGNTKDEGTLFAGLFGTLNGSGVSGFKPNDYERFTLQYQFNPDAPGSLREADLISAPYLPVTALPFGWNALSAFVTNLIFTGPIVPQLNSLSAQQLAQTWYYQFDWRQAPAPFDTVYGATHALDLPFLFGNFGPSALSFAYGKANQPGREALSGAMMDSLAAFARTGNPNHASLGVSWPNWPGRIVFDATQTQLATSVP